MPITEYQDLPWTERVDVEVLEDGSWHAGELAARRHNEGAGGYVRYTVARDGFREGKVTWFNHDQVRPLGRAAP